MLLALYFPPTLIWADGESGGGLISFSGNAQLREAVWKLAAFVPAGGGNGEKRTLRVSDIKGLPPVAISLTYGDPLDPWPEGLELIFQAEAARPPVFFIVRDKRPFGGPNIEFDGPVPGEAGRREAERPQTLLLNILSNLNARLLAGRPRLTPFQWIESGPGFETARSRLLYGARLGPDDIFLLRFAPDKFVFRPYHESEFPGEAPGAIDGWSEKLTSAVAIINGGQYYPDRSYMGVLERGGQNFSAGPHRQWKGFIVSEPKPGAPPDAPSAAVIDLDETERGLRTSDYFNVMQSFMLLDSKGVIRVRDSRNLAGRTALGEDQSGRLVLIMTPSAISLYDLAVSLKSSSLGLQRVMAFDGGFEAQMFLRRNGDGFVAGGQFSLTENRSVYIPGYSPPLPAVLAVEPLAPAEAEAEGEEDASGRNGESAPKRGEPADLPGADGPEDFPGTAEPGE